MIENGIFRVWPKRSHAPAPPHSRNQLITHPLVGPVKASVWVTNPAPRIERHSYHCLVVVGTEYLDSLTIKANRDRPMLEKIRGQKEGKRRCAKEEEKNEEHAALARRPTNKTAIPGRKAVGWMRQ